MHKNKSKSGFTLVELSVVIVIIGLLVAGVVGGGNLVKQAQLRAVVSEYNQYDLAVNAFQLEYDALPGDIRNAYAYWGTNCAPSPTECNGSGNGRIHYTDVTPMSQENFMVWKHLALAGIVSGSFTGKADTAGVHDMTPRINVPESKFPAGGWMLDSNNVWPGLTEVKNRLSIGSESKVNPSHVFDVLFTPEQAKSIDDKIDDGIPLRGKVKGLVGFAAGLTTNCTVGTGAAATYILTETVARCQILFDLTTSVKTF